MRCSFCVWKGMVRHPAIAFPILLTKTSCISAVTMICSQPKRLPHGLTIYCSLWDNGGRGIAKRSKQRCKLRLFESATLYAHTKFSPVPPRVVAKNRVALHAVALSKFWANGFPITLAT
jgi:hypothetical protein